MRTAWRGSSRSWAGWRPAIFPLEESLKIFEEGIGLARSCARYLEDAEKRIEVLAKDESGALGARPFAWEPEREQ